MRLKPSIFSLMAATILTAAIFSSAGAQIRINEMRIDHTSADTDEYVEISGPAGTPLTNHWVVVVGDSGAAATCGYIETAIDLSAYSIQADGVFCLRYSGGIPVLTGYDVTLAGSFENSDNLSVFLVTGYVAPLGTKKLDSNNDGVLDVTPWTSIVDQVGFNKGTVANCTTEEFLYATPAVGPDGTFVPGHLWRCSDTLAWNIGPFALTGGQDTPGAPNAPCLSPLPTISLERRDVCAPLLSQAVVVTDSIPNATSASMDYSINGGAPTTVAMTSIGSDKWQATIPGQAVNGTRVSYQVSALNGTGGDIGFTWGYFVGTMTTASLRSVNVTGVEAYRFYGARIHGTVTCGQGVFSLINTDFWVQDATGGIRIFKFGLPAVSPALGDEVEIAGELDQFNGLLELENSTVCGDLDIQVINPGSPPAPTLITSCQLGEATEGLLVRMQYPLADTTLSGTVGGTTAGNWRPNRTYRITDCYPDTTLLFIDADTDIDGTPVISTQMGLVGISNQFDTVTPFLSGYQVIPRGLADITYVTTAGIGDNPVRLQTRLLPNSPNPFNGLTTIRYQIAGAPGTGSSQVSLNLFDVAGRKVKTLVEARQPAGAYEISVDATQLGDVHSGIFFYELQVDGKSMATRKMVISR